MMERVPLITVVLAVSLLGTLLGIDRTRLTYRFSGRDMRLTDVHGQVIPEIVGT